MQIRQITEADYLPVMRVLNEWWSGREMTDMLPHLFFSHFTNTSFIVEEEENIIGFLIGFLSQSKKDEAYIHFVGIHPEYRGKSLGKQLYQHFFQTVLEEKNSMTVKCVTSPVNKNSIAFHTKMGFEIQSSSVIEDGISIQKDYDGVGQDRVVFKRLIKK